MTTIGRLAHDAPAELGSYGEKGGFLTPDSAANQFTHRRKGIEIPDENVLPSQRVP